MVRTAVRALTLNFYHVGDVGVTRFVVRSPQATYFTNLVEFFKKQFLDLNSLVSDALDCPGSDKSSAILAAVDEIEDALSYFSDITSAGSARWSCHFFVLDLLHPSYPQNQRFGEYHSSWAFLFTGVICSELCP
ncbi:hypothetical protein MLD38_014874 [Melastoma candidum]|uniref:Uncharacterized protein n=1 Tax=Melastoma candidum TaxID=119954 RepID=A0ACB9RDH9_9MYRT|nr:hypothetical protein MLD38_014874 [Melastoma candidum]